MLTFASDSQRQKAEYLMQPALIRVLDNLRKRMEASSWRGEYQEQLMWPHTTTEAQKQRVIELQNQAQAENTKQQEAIQAELNQLPTPYPSYELHLHREGQPEQIFSVWQLCCQACFIDYDSEQPATVDESLIEADGEIDWLRLDQKVCQLIDAVFPEAEPA